MRGHERGKGANCNVLLDDAQFYIRRAIELARIAGRDGIVARLSLQRDQITRSYNRQGALVVALPLDLATELLGEGLDQPAANPGIGASRIDPLAVVSDRKV